MQSTEDNVNHLDELSPYGFEEAVPETVPKGSFKRGLLILFAMHAVCFIITCFVIVITLDDGVWIGWLEMAVGSMFLTCLIQIFYAPIAATVLIVRNEQKSLAGLGVGVFATLALGLTAFLSQAFIR
ncbi:hypothetical protein OAU50_03300 [Planctomycetota bacterium]|nr:hypothetical protein [Planctomycetota bacterium]